MIEKPGKFRIFASIFYDIWLIVAILMVGVTIDTFIRAYLYGDASDGNHSLLQLYFVVAPLFFFGWFWTHGGQTLGMRSWRIRVITSSGDGINRKQAVIRYLVAIISCGLSHLWMFIDKEGLALHDHLSKTQLIITDIK